MEPAWPVWALRGHRRSLKRAAEYLPKAPNTIEALFKWGLQVDGDDRGFVRLVGGSDMPDSWVGHGFRRLEPKHRATIRGSLEHLRAVR